MAITGKLTYEDAVRYAEELVAGFGADHVYTRLDGRKGGAISCVYADLDENNVFHPSCIVGRIFAKHGMTGEELADWDGHGTIGCVYDDSLPPSRPKRPEADEATVSFLAKLQSFQDAGHTWGASLEYAKAKAAA